MSAENINQAIFRLENKRDKMYFVFLFPIITKNLNLGNEDGTIE